MDAIVMAGGIPQPEDPLYEYTQGEPKALLDIAGKPMIQWVLDAISGSESVERVVLISLPEDTNLECSKQECDILQSLFLLTRKPVLYVANVGEPGVTGGDERAAELAKGYGADRVLLLCCQLEAELLSLSPEERSEYLEALGLERPGVERLIRATYALLGLITFFTFNEKEVRAWTIRRGTHAPQAAGVVHTDFEKGFIRAETVSFDDFSAAGSLKAARDQGLVRAEGRDHVVEDGDILLFRAHS